MYTTEADKRRIALLTRNKFENNDDVNDEVKIMTMTPKKKGRMSILRRLLAEESPEMGEMMKTMRLKGETLDDN